MPRCAAKRPSLECPRSRRKRSRALETVKMRIRALTVRFARPTRNRTPANGATVNAEAAVDLERGRSRVRGGSGRFGSGYARFVSVTPGNGEEHPSSGEWKAPPSGEWEAPPSAEREARRAERTQRREAATERPEGMIPSRGKRLPLEAPLMRVVATAGIVGIGVAIAAIMNSQHLQGMGNRSGGIDRLRGAGGRRWSSRRL